MSYLPIIVNAGQLQQLPSGQAIDVGGWTLPTSGGTVNYVLVADSGGNGIWSSDLTGLTSLIVDNITLDGSTITSTGVLEIESPTSINSSEASSTWDLQVGGANSIVRVGTVGGTAHVSIGNKSTNEVSALEYEAYFCDNAYWDSSGEEWLPIRADLPRRAKFSMGYHQYGFTWDFHNDAVASITWTELMKLSYTGALTVLDTVTADGTLVLATGSISCTTGTITFNDENLNTTGKMAIGATSVYSNSHAEVVGVFGGNKYYSALHVRTVNNTYGTFLGSALSGRAIWSAGAHFATGSNWKARATSGTGIYQNLGIIQFFTNTGLTEGVDYTPTSRGYFNASGLTVTGVVVANNITAPTDADQVLISTAPGVASFTDQIWPRLLTANETIYIRTTGDDGNSGESVGEALATVGEGIKRLYERIADGYTITVDLDEGVYTEASAIAPAYPYGAQVEWRGVSESHTSVSVSNIGTKTSGPTGLEYIDFNVTLPVTYSCSIGDFISVTSATGGTNPHLVMGIHEVTAYNGGTRVATVRSYRRSGVTPVPSGSISVNITVVKTVIYFSGSNGMVLNGAFHSGTWGKTGYGIVFKGPHTNNGLWALNGATIILGNDAGTSGWASNLFAQNNGLIFADYTCHSKSDANIVKLQNGAVVNLRGGAVLSGSRTRGVECFIGATAALDSCNIYTCGGSFGIICYKGGFVDFASGILKDGLGTGVEADTGGGVDCTAYTNNYSIATDDNAGDGSIYT